MFRSIGQVLGVALSAALLQAILIRDLKESIVGPEAEKVICHLPHSARRKPKTNPDFCRSSNSYDIQHHPSKHFQRYTSKQP